MSMTTIETKPSYSPRRRIAHSQRIGNNAFNLVDEESAHSFKDFVVFLRGHLCNRPKNHMLFDAEKTLRTNEAGCFDFASFTIGFVQRNGESIPVCAARDLAKNQIRA